MTPLVRWWHDRKRIKGARDFDWPPRAALDPDKPVLFVRVHTPADQSALHRLLGARGYWPYLYGTDDDGCELWRFQQHDGQLA